MYINPLSWPGQENGISNNSSPPPLRLCVTASNHPFRSLLRPLSPTSSLSLRDRELVSELGPPLELTAWTNVLCYTDPSVGEDSREAHSMGP